jgi:lipid-binding SYLF domain-containing protein
MTLTGEDQSVSAGPLGLTRTSMSAAVRGHNSVFVFALP